MREGCAGGARLLPLDGCCGPGPRCEAAADGGGRRELLLGRGAYRPGLSSCDCCTCCCCWPVACCRGRGGGGIKEEDSALAAGCEGAVGCDGGDGGDGGGGIIVDSFLATFPGVF